MIIIILTLIILILILLLIYYYFNTKKEHFSNNINILNKNELEKLLIADNDNYYKTFNNKDYKVRNIKTINDYYIKIKNSCININIKQKNDLIKCVNIANNKLKTIKIDGFDGNKCADIIWNIGFIKGNEYEYELPHTRNNIIILPINLLSNFFNNRLINILIHEKIHVYQKMYPDDINKYLEKNGYIKYKNRNEFTNLRANPDLDNYIYMNSNKQIMKAEYIENPKTINDVIIEPINDYKYEHPLEYMAYIIEKSI